MPLCSQLLIRAYFWWFQGHFYINGIIRVLVASALNPCPVPAWCWCSPVGTWNPPCSISWDLPHFRNVQLSLRDFSWICSITVNIFLEHLYILLVEYVCWRKSLSVMFLALHFMVNLCPERNSSESWKFRKQDYCSDIDFVFLFFFLVSNYFS